MKAAPSGSGKSSGRRTGTMIPAFLGLRYTSETMRCHRLVKIRYHAFITIYETLSLPFPRIKRGFFYYSHANLPYIQQVTEIFMERPKGGNLKNERKKNKEKQKRLDLRRCHGSSFERQDGYTRRDSGSAPTGRRLFGRIFDADRYLNEMIEKRTFA